MEANTLKETFCAMQTNNKEIKNTTSEIPDPRNPRKKEVKDEICNFLPVLSKKIRIIVTKKIYLKKYDDKHCM